MHGISDGSPYHNQWGVQRHVTKDLHDLGTGIACRVDIISLIQQLGVGAAWLRPPRMLIGGCFVPLSMLASSNSPRFQIGNLLSRTWR